MIAKWYFNILLLSDETVPTFVKSHTGVIFGREGLVRLLFPNGLFMGCFELLNPYGARRFIIYALTFYGPSTGRQNSYGALRAPREDVRILLTAWDQPAGAQALYVSGPK